MTLNIGFFSFAIYVLYLAFVPWEAVQTMPATVATKWRERRQREPT